MLPLNVMSCHEDGGGGGGGGGGAAVAAAVVTAAASKQIEAHVLRLLDLRVVPPLLFRLPLSLSLSLLLF